MDKATAVREKALTISYLIIGHLFYKQRKGLVDEKPAIFHDSITKGDIFLYSLGIVTLSFFKEVLV
jgi:hypothetical protein